MVNNIEDLEKDLIQLKYDWGIDYTNLEIYDKETITDNLQNLLIDITSLIYKLENE